MKNYDLTELNILVLEKHSLIRKLLYGVFQEFGVATIQNTQYPDVAWEMLQSIPADIILSDWTHDLDGLQFLTRVRRAPDTPDPYVPVIICTANTEMKEVCEARDRGMTEFLAKPVSASLIYSRIARVIENNRAFIRISDFMGPDRRRMNMPGFTSVERRRAA